MFVDSIEAAAIPVESYDAIDSVLPDVSEGQHRAAAFGAIV